MIDLSGKRAMVCGSTKGIGRACAAALAECGATLTLVARDEAALAAYAEELGRRGAGSTTSADRPSPSPSLAGRGVSDAVAGSQLGEPSGAHFSRRHAFVVADFRDHAELRERIARHVAETGPIEVLVNNTGGPAAGPIVDATPEQFLDAFKMHVLCNQMLVQTLLPGMKQRGYGRVVNIISTSVREPIPGIGVSNTTRWAVAAWAKTLSREVAPFGITVNNVLPGFTDTERLAELFDSRAAREGKTRAQVAEAARQLIPAGRFATPEEIAAAVAFLASPAAAYVNGVNLPVDGGRLASM